MKTLLILLFVIVGLIFTISVMLQSPKGGLGFAIGGVSNANEYGSKKSLESTLKKAAMTTGVAFVVLAIILPYIIN